MNEVLENIYHRRSVRSYAPDPVPEDVIGEVIRAGVRAPNGMNVQALRFVVITDRDALLHYGAEAKTLFSGMLKKNLESDPPNKESLEHLKRNMDDPKFDIFYGAPCLILVFAAPHALTPLEDGALCAENMMLAAHSLGLGSCWIGFASPLGHSPEIMQELKVPKDHKLVAPIIIGHPKKADGKPTPRNEPVVLNWIDGT